MSIRDEVSPNRDGAGYIGEMPPEAIVLREDPNVGQREERLDIGFRRVGRQRLFEDPRVGSNAKIREQRVPRKADDLRTRRPLGEALTGASVPGARFV